MHYDSVERAWSVNGGGATIYIYIHIHVYILILTYIYFIYIYPVFRDVRKILEELHVILASDDGHKKVFHDVPIIGFKIDKNLKLYLVRSQLPD